MGEMEEIDEEMAGMDPYGVSIKLVKDTNLWQFSYLNSKMEAIQIKFNHHQPVLNTLWSIGRGRWIAR